MIKAIDTGYGYTKDSDGDIFESKVSENATALINNSDSFKITLELGTMRTFLIGSAATNRMFDLDKVNNEITKALVYGSLCRTIPQEKAEIQLVVGTPIEQYKQQRNKLENYLTTRDYKQVWYNGVRKLINIPQVKIFPQAAATFFTVDQAITANKVIGILDWGAFTVDGCIFVNGKLDQSRLFTLPEGIIPLETRLQSVLNKEYGLNISEVEIPGILKQGLLIKGKKEVKADRLISSTLAGYMQLILNKLILTGWSVDTMEIWITGGGVLLIPETIISFIPHAITVEDPQFSNARGYKNVGKTIYNQNN